MSKEPLISVVMAAHNAEKFIKEAMDSILNQALGDFEFLIIDDGSTDKTEQIIFSYHDPRIIFTKNEANIGQTRCLNMMIKRARGEFIARMDADDISYLERFKLQYDYMVKNKEVAVLGTKYLEIDEQGKIIRKFNLPVDSLEIKCYLQGSCKLSYHCVPHPAVLMRREPILKAGLYNEKYLAQDYDLWVRLSRKYRIANLDKVLFKYRILKNSVTSRLPEVLDKDSREIIMNNIKYYWPDLGDNDCLCLTRMLEFLPQESIKDSKKVFALLDIFLDKVIGQDTDKKKVKEIKNRIKIYYLPKLFLSHKLFSISQALKLIPRRPGMLLDKKLYAKIYKTFLNQRDMLRQPNQAKALWKI